MIERSFVHLPQVNIVRERRLWEAGFSSWEKVCAGLRKGRTIAELISGIAQRTLFPVPDLADTDPRIRIWIDVLEQSQAALQGKDYEYFVSRLSPGNQWRLLDRVETDALFLDIETTGLSRELHYPTVIGALYKRKFYQWVWPEPLDVLADLLLDAPLVVTFNGRRFDLPFLRRYAPAMPPPRAHLDLLPVVRAAGIKGGQKDVEIALGLARDAGIQGLDGFAAVAAWCGALYGDRKSYRKLLDYNRADVEMMPRIAAIIYDRRSREIEQRRVPKKSIKLPGSTRVFHRPAPFAALESAWQERRPHLTTLQPAIVGRFGREPVVVGVDLRSKETNPTGWAVCVGRNTQTEVLYSDEEILARTLAAKPDLVSIDAPLFLPRGRTSVSDDSPCRPIGGIVRDAERILWSRKIRVYPALIRQMQGLTKRGIELAEKLRSHGIEVIESYPGAAQDVLNIPRKKDDESLLHKGLVQFGYTIDGRKTHDELDAITSALVGHFYLADRFEGIGASDEGYMIIPRWNAMSWERLGDLNSTKRPTVFLLGLPGAGKTTVARALASVGGWDSFVLGDQLRKAASTDSSLRAILTSGRLAPETTVEQLIRLLASEHSSTRLVVDGYPRHAGQLELAEQLFENRRLVLLDVELHTAAQRLFDRHTCCVCNAPFSKAETVCPTCGATESHERPEDGGVSLTRRLNRLQNALDTLLRRIPRDQLVRVDANQSLDRVLSQATATIS